MKGVKWDKYGNDVDPHIRSPIYQLNSFPVVLPRLGGSRSISNLLLKLWKGYSLYGWVESKLENRLKTVRPVIASKWRPFLPNEIGRIVLLVIGTMEWEVREGWEHSVGLLGLFYCYFCRSWIVDVQRIDFIIFICFILSSSNPMFALPMSLGVIELHLYKLWHWHKKQ